MYECQGCEENCHATNIPWYGNECLAGRVQGECFRQINTVSEGEK
jgi:hypothetical protein